MRAIQVPRPGAPFELVERPLPEPRPGEVRITVQACGVCHSDAIAKEGWAPGIPYPIVPGHEVAGVIDKVGEGVIDCQNLRIPGLNFDGGYAEAMIVPASDEAPIRHPSA